MTDFNLTNISQGVFETIFNLLTNFVNIRINTILSKVNVSIPIFSTLVFYLTQLFDIILNYCLFILDASFISSELFSYLIISYIFQISSRMITYVIKLVVKWWHALAPQKGSVFYV